MSRDKTDRISVEQYRAFVGVDSTQPKRAHKYGAKPVVQNGIRFDSSIEQRRYQSLRLLEAAGIIEALRHHPRYTLTDACEVEGVKQRAVVYEADFEYLHDGRTVTEDVKGFITPEAKRKMKQFAARYQRLVRVVKKANDPIG